MVRLRLNKRDEEFVVKVNFNSIMVRLRHNEKEDLHRRQTHFNSIMVRLRHAFSDVLKDISRFQFHYGAIKTACS